jgi:hypothetical protein
MSLSHYEITMNETILKNIVERLFSSVKNKQELQQTVLKILNDNNLSLQTHTGIARDFLQQAIARCIKDQQFKANLAQASLNIAFEAIQRMEQEAKQAYLQQRPEMTIERQLLTKGYVETGHLLTHTDIKQMFDGYLRGNHYTDPISITEDRGSALSEALTHFKDIPGKVLIPANINANHWILIIRKEDGNLTCWDPLSAPMTKTESATEKTIKKVAEEVYKTDRSVKVDYVYAGEQKDGVTCGYRVTQKAFKECGVENDLVKVPTNNPSLLCFQYVKLLSKTVEPLKEKELAVIEESAPLVYLEEKYDEPEVQEVVNNKKYIQETSDEYLAVVLQDIYRKNPEISDQEAGAQAKEQLEKTNQFELEKTKSDVVAWMQRLKSPVFASKSCKEEVEKITYEADGKSPLVSS